jgi:peptidoglycan/xylan/chitin deacetylase (PgdA/CDA1 family)
MSRPPAASQSAPNLTIVMYHYVRPLRGRFAALKGLDIDLFAGQLAYLRRHYTPVSMQQVIAAGAGTELPPRPVLLTFDDGYSDHHRFVFPLLAEAGISGAFFPPAGAVLERRMLDVNKIHFLLAAVPDVAMVIDCMEAQLQGASASEQWALASLSSYRAQYQVAGRFDPAEVIYLKRMLQHALPAPLRSQIVDGLFTRFVTADQAEFAEELYLTTDQLRQMATQGMHVGSHGGDHRWLDRMTRAEQALDIDAGLRLLDVIGQPRAGFTFCYPYGG